MTARSLFEVASGIAPQNDQREKGQPVRRHSYFTDHRRVQATKKPLDKKLATVAQRLTAAERYDRDTRKQGERMGPLGQIGLEVYRLLHFLPVRDGLLDPAIDYIAKKVRRCRKAVNQALARLKDHGFLDWVRRAEPVPENEGKKGVQVKQIPNAYEILLPKVALDYIRGRNGPDKPVCEQERAKERREDQSAMEATLPGERFHEALKGGVGRDTSEQRDINAFWEVMSRVGGLAPVSNANSLKSQIQGHRD